MHRQWSGVNGVTFFAPQLFVGVSTLGTGNEGWLIAAVIVNGVQLLATFITVITVDRLGRRMLLLTGSTFGFVTEIAVAVTLATTASTAAVDLPYGASIASIVLVSCFPQSTDCQQIVMCDAASCQPRAATARLAEHDKCCICTCRWQLHLDNY